jgi:hypothetical protein
MRKLLFLIFISASIAAAQGNIPPSVLQAVPNATITVCSSVGGGIPCSPLVTIYSNAALTVVAPNPFTADANGNFVFYVAPNATGYIYSVTASRITGQLFTILPQTTIVTGGISGTIVNGQIIIGVSSNVIGGNANFTYVAPLFNINGTSFQNVASLTNPTASTGGGNQNSPQYCYNASFWTGAVSAPDVWCMSLLTSTGSSQFSVLHTPGIVTDNSYFTIGGNAGLNVSHTIITDVTNRGNLCQTNTANAVNFTLLRAGCNMLIHHGAGGNAAQLAALQLEEFTDLTSAGFTVTEMMGMDVSTPIATGGAAITTEEGITIEDQHATNVTNSIGLRIKAQSGAAPIAIKTESAAPSELTGPLQSIGSGATLTGTGACATITTQSGGAWAGSAKCTAATAASTLTITFATTMPNGYVCNVQDETTRANLFEQTSHSATTCVLTITSVTQNDVFVFSGIGF